MSCIHRLTFQGQGEATSLSGELCGGMDGQKFDSVAMEGGGGGGGLHMVACGAAQLEIPSPISAHHRHRLKSITAFCLIGLTKKNPFIPCIHHM